MKNPFALSDDHLKTLLSSYSAWSQGHELEKDYAKIQKRLAQELKKTLLNKGYLLKVSDNELFQRIFEHSRSLEGPAYINLGEPRINAEKGKVKRNLIYFIESKEDPFKKAAEILAGKYKISHFARAFWTPIFQAQYPNLLPNWNNKTDKFFKKLGINSKTARLTVEENYRVLSDSFLYLQGLDPSQDFHTLNHLMHYGTVISEGVDVIEKLIGKEGDSPLEEERPAYWRVIEPFDSREVNIWEGCKKRGLIAIGYLTKPEAREIRAMRDKMRRGDKVVAYLLEGRIGGLGTIVGEYEDYTDEKPEKEDYFEGDFWRRRAVKWDHLPDQGQYWQLPEKMPGGRPTVSQLTKEEFDRVKELIGIKDEKIRMTKEAILAEVFLDETRFDQIIALFDKNEKRQVILQGPPGTGKTFIATKIGQYLAKPENRIDIIQFHPSYSYEDFIEGYRPDDGGAFQLREGIFKAFCEKAGKDPGNDFVLIIDEINRGNLSKIFGELLYLLEYRDQEVTLTYSSESFSIPKNLCIIGTMNTADRSLAIMDYALRRRFHFVDLKCETERLGGWLKDNGCTLDVEVLVGRLQKVNEAIANEMRSGDFAIGHSYFMKKDLDSARLRQIIAFEIKPLLEEYFFDKRETVEQILTEFEEYAG